MNMLPKCRTKHAGYTLKKIMKDKNIAVEYLATRTGTKLMYIQQIIDGKKDISPDMAKRLQYSLGIDASYWINLQAIYDESL